MTLPAEGQQLSNANPSGSSYGQSTADLISFYGATPLAQQSGAAQAAVTNTAATQTTPWGFSTSTQANAIVTLVNEMRQSLVDLGLIAGA